MNKYLTELADMVKAKRKRRIAVAVTSDTNVLEALKNVDGHGIVEPILVGIKSRIHEICEKIEYDVSRYEIIDIEDRFEASLMASRLIERIKFIAPVHVYPGEDEMRALALNGLRILTG